MVVVMTKILVFDSGSGNVPIACAIREHLPECELNLLSDTEFFPYGERRDQDLIERMQLILAEAYTLLKPDIIVLACNTASTIALDILREQFSCPIIGVVPAIKPAAEATKSNIIGLIATPATIKRSYTKQLISEFAPGCEVIRHGSTELVKMSETHAETGEYDETLLTEILAPFISARAKGLDQLVLGCTHFALLEKPISDILPNVAIVDSSDAIGRQVKRVLRESVDAQNTRIDDAIMSFFITKNSKIIKID